MKTKKILSIALAVTMLLCASIIPASATETDEHIEIIIENEKISEETKEKIIDFYSTDCEEQEGATTYGLTCTLFGHKLETTRVYKITHEVRTTAPRCLKKTYDYSACTRCDYEESLLLTSEYIACC